MITQKSKHILYTVPFIPTYSTRALNTQYIKPKASELNKTKICILITAASTENLRIKSSLEKDMKTSKLNICLNQYPVTED